VSDVDDIEFVTDGRVYVSPPNAGRAPFIAVFGDLSRPVVQGDAATLPFVAAVRTPDGATFVVDDAVLDFPVHPESSGETHAVILRGIAENIVPKGSVIIARRGSG
jgi:hypothetical protein